MPKTYLKCAIFPPTEGGDVVYCQLRLHQHKMGLTDHMIKFITCMKRQEVHPLNRPPGDGRKLAVLDLCFSFIDFLLKPLIRTSSKAK